MDEIRMAPLVNSAATVAMLSEMLIETVANGGSVSFMHPLSFEAARAFWHDSLASAAQHERVVFGAWHGDALVGTVTLLVNCPPNQPHRADIAKMMTRSAYRGRGIAAALLRLAEEEAVRRGRTLLVLDTATDGGAGAFYEKSGYTRAGTIPDYALKPHGGLTGTEIYWKRLGSLEP